MRCPSPLSRPLPARPSRWQSAFRILPGRMRSCPPPRFVPAHGRERLEPQNMRCPSPLSRPLPAGLWRWQSAFRARPGRGRERPIAAHLRISGGREHRVQRAGEPERALLQLRHGRLCGRRPVYTTAYRAISSRPAKPASSGSRPFLPCPNGMCVSAPDRRLKASGAACRGDRLLQHREHMRGAYRRVCRGDRLLQHRE